MKPDPQSDLEWTVHAINIHGVFFERWCQQVISQSSGWSVVATNYPVEFPQPNSPIRGRESSLDIRADRVFNETKVSLIIECKKNNPDLTNWIFFPRTADPKGQFIVSANRIEPAPLPDPKWGVSSSIEALVGNVVVVDDARETRGDYLKYKANNKTKTSSAAVHEAAFQVALAKQAIVSENLTFERALGDAATSPKPQPHLHLFIPVIVTTASLFTCKFDSSDIDPATGEIPLDKVTLQPCSRLVYEYGIPKQLQTRPSNLAGALTSGVIDRFTRMHVMIVHSSDFPNFLANYFQ